LPSVPHSPHSSATQSSAPLVSQNEIALIVTARRASPDFVARLAVVSGLLALAWGFLPAAAQNAEPVPEAEQAVVTQPGTVSAGEGEVPQGTPSEGGTGEAPSADSLRARIQDAGKQLEGKKQTAAEREKRILDFAKQREELNAKLIGAAEAIQQSEQDLTRIEARVAELAVEEKQMRSNLLSQNSTLIKLLGALQRMGRDPPPVLITRRDDALKMVRSALQISAVFPELRDKALVLATKLGALDKVLADVKSEGQQLTDATTKYASEQKQLAELIERNQTEMTAEVQQLGIDRDQIEQGLRTVADLTGALNTVVANVEQLPALRSTLGKYDQELETALLAPAEPAEPEPAAPASPARIKPAKPFDRMKKQLPLPVEGRRILGFGDVTKTGIRLKGQAYATRPAALVTAPCDGWVVYAGEFRNYGQLLIINAGGGYHVLLAGLSQVDVTMGQFVLGRQPVGKMGSKRSSASAANSATASTNDGTSAKAADSSPLFYVEFRHKEQPINPAPWWSVVAEKVQG
jgi:murein hydrolase activator